MLAFPLCACCCIQTRGCNLVVFPAQRRHVEDGLHPVRCLFTTTRKLTVQLHLLEKSGDLILPPNVLCSLMLPIVYKFWIYFFRKKAKDLRGGVGYLQGQSEWWVCITSISSSKYRQTMHTRVKMGILPGFSCMDLSISILSYSCDLSSDLTSTRKKSAGGWPHDTVWKSGGQS